MPLDPPRSPAVQPGTLRALLRATPRLAPERAVRLLGAIARALTVWQARTGTYGALTPERVLVGPDDGVTLAPPPRTEGAPAPWPTYLAPEQIDGRPGDVRSDVYALGLVGWEMLAGQQPWEGESLYGVVVKQREQDLPRLSTLRPGMPRALVLALEGCLHKAPGDRWQTVAEFLTALEPGGAPAPAAGYAPGFAPERRAPPAPPAGPVAGAVARAAAAGAVPGASPEPYHPLPPARPTPRPPVDDGDDDDGERDDTPARAPVGTPRRRTRWLAGAVLTLALLGAGAATLVALRGRTDSGATQTWLDSVTAPAAAVGAVPATTTRENTTAAPIRRSVEAAEPSDPEVIDDEAPEESPGDSVTEPPFEALCSSRRRHSSRAPNARPSPARPSHSSRPTPPSRPICQARADERRR